MSLNGYIQHTVWIENKTEQSRRIFSLAPRHPRLIPNMENIKVGGSKSKVWENFFFHGLVKNHVIVQS